MLGLTVTNKSFGALAEEACSRIEDYAKITTIRYRTFGDHKVYLNKLEALAKHTSTKGQSILFFDADLWMIRDFDFSKFEDIDEVVVVKDPGSINYHPKCFVLPDCKNFGLDSSRYFNSGFMIVNYRHHDLFVEAINVFKKGGYADFGEQTSINVAAQKLKTPIFFEQSDRFNHMVKLAHKERPCSRAEHPVLIHAAGYSGARSKEVALRAKESQLAIKY